MIACVECLNNIKMSCLPCIPASAAESAASAAIEKLNEPGVENNLLSGPPIRNGGAVCECRLLSISSSLFELFKKKSHFVNKLCPKKRLVDCSFSSIYLSDPLPSLPPKYLMSLSPTESLLCSSDGKLWFPQTSSMGSDLTLSFIRLGGDGVRLSLSVDDDDSPLPFGALLLKLFASNLDENQRKKLHFLSVPLFDSLKMSNWWSYLLSEE